jgi:hypothetical protein
MAEYLYSNECLTGILGVSDYCFQCTITADSPEEALAWGHEVARAYNRVHGLLPHGNRLNEAHIERNGSISPSGELLCKAGEMPDFEKYRANQEALNKIWRNARE